MSIRNVLIFGVTVSLLGLPLSVQAGNDGAYPPLSRVASADSTPSNLWMTQAMMADMVRETESHLPAAASKVLLKPGSPQEASVLLQQVMTSMLAEAGYELYLDEAKDPASVDTAAVDTAAAVKADAEIRYELESVKLSYPASGRRFHLWRQWVDRELDLSMFVTIVDPADGRIIWDQRLVRRYADRIPAGRFAAVSSPAYRFTQAEVQSSGFRGVLENIVVIGSLAGLVAVYFANSGS